MKAIRRIFIGLLSALLLCAALFAGRGIVMMITDVKNGVETTAGFNPRQRVRKSIADAQRERMLAYIDGNREVLIAAAMAAVPEDTVFAALNSAGEPVYYGMYYANLGPVQSDALRSVLQEGFVRRFYPGEASEFETYSDGMASSSVAIGFYHSPEDAPMWADALPQDETPVFEQDGSGWWLNEDILGDVVDSVYYEYYTERLCENFFYYEKVDA